MTNTLNLTVNGILYPIADPQDRTLLDILRSEFGLKGAKYGCGKAQCGACTVLIEGCPPGRACCGQSVPLAVRSRHWRGLLTH